MKKTNLNSSFAPLRPLRLCVILFSILCLFSCPSPLDVMSDNFEKQHETPNKEKPFHESEIKFGYFAFDTNDADNASRAISPANQQLTDFLRYALVFNPDTAAGNTNAQVIEYRTSADLNDTVALPAGDWELWVLAYKDAAALYGTAPSAAAVYDGIIEITEGNITYANPLDIELELFMDGQGNFVWTISWPNTVTLSVARMTITPKGGTANVIDFRNWIHQIQGSSIVASRTETLNSGFYDVLVELVTSDGKRTGFSDELYIYRDLNSNLTLSNFNASHFTYIDGAGSGVAGDPFIVRSASTLEKVGRGTANPDPYKGWTLNAYYLQAVDITLPGGGGTSNWTRIGATEANGFKGVYDGGGKSINNLVIAMPSANNTSNNFHGMFGYINSIGIVRNLTVKGSVSGREDIGGIAGHNSGLIENCSFYGDVRGTQYVAGLVADHHGTIDNCFFSGNVISTSSHAGGLVSGNASLVKNSFSTGYIEGTQQNGGIVADNVGTGSYNGRIENCYSTADVTATAGSQGGNGVGGIAGNNTGSILNCYSTGIIKSGGARAGGIVGNNSSIVRNSVALNLRITNNAADRIGRVMTNGNSANTTNNYARSDMDIRHGVPVSGIGGTDKNMATSALANNVDGEGITSAQWSSLTWWQNTAFTGISADDWAWWQGKLPLNLPGADGSGSGTAADPYIVGSENTLRQVGRGTGDYSAWDLSKYYKMTSDIMLTVPPTGSNWTKIGAFTGTFDGNGFKITGLTIRSNLGDEGMFSQLNPNAVVKNLGLENVNITGISYVGGITGFNNGGRIENCYVTGSITGVGWVGGIVGTNVNNGTTAMGRTIINCYVIADISGDSPVGGIVGQNANNCVVQNNVFIRMSSVGSVTRTSGDSSSFGRIVGIINGGNVINNYASDNAQFISGGTPSTIFPSFDNTQNGKDGVSISSAQAVDASWWTTTLNAGAAAGTAWDFVNIWEVTNGSLPRLREK